MKKICFVLQRYGEDIVGGSEAYCRQIAERLADHYEVEVLTSKAREYTTWANSYEADVETINGVVVRRFPTLTERCITPDIHAHAFGAASTVEDGIAWVDAQGPYCPSLVEYLRENADAYDALVLMTYLYYPTVMVAREFGEKSLMIPTAHDEPPIYQPVYDTVFNNVKGIYYLTVEEKEFVEGKFELDGTYLSSGSGGVGVEVPERLDVEEFRRKFGIGDAKYIVYAGRIEPAKGCRGMIRYFLEYKQRNPSDLKLVLMGKSVMDIPKDDDIVEAGFVSEDEKFSGMKGAVALVQPSQFESLSIVALEALAVGTPLIVNSACHVLKGHCVRSSAGLFYDNYLEFEAELNALVERPGLRNAMSVNAKAYIEENYTWDRIMRDLRDAIEIVASD